MVDPDSPPSTDTSSRPNESDAAPVPRASTGGRGKRRAWVIDLLIIAIVLFGLGMWRARALPDRGDTVPSFELSDLAGNTFTSADLNGQSTLLVFVAPWCGVCKAETANLNRLANNSPAGIRVVGVASSYEDAASIREYVDAHDVDFPMLLADDELVGRFGVSSFPSHVFVDATGKVSVRHIGYITTAGLYVRSWMARLL